MSTIFNKAFAKAIQIPFNPSWAKGSDRFDNAVNGEYAPKLKAGELAKSTDQYDRRIILLGTPKGNVIVFNGVYGNYTKYGLSVSSSVEMILSNSIAEGGLNENTMKVIFGDVDCQMIEPNIGKRMAFF